MIMEKKTFWKNLLPNKQNQPVVHLKTITLPVLSEEQLEQVSGGVRMSDLSSEGQLIGLLSGGLSGGEA